MIAEPATFPTPPATLPATLAAVPNTEEIAFTTRVSNNKSVTAQVIAPCSFYL